MNYASYTGIVDLFRRGELNESDPYDLEDKPVMPMNLLADFAGGSFYLFSQIMQALLERDDEPSGIVIDSSLTHNTLYFSQVPLL